MDLAPDVAIVGAGPAGLAAAMALKAAGTERVLVLDREAEPGGVPRHCGHPPYGLREYRRLMTGPQYAERNVAEAEAAGAVIVPDATVVALRQGPVLSVTTPQGAVELTPRRVLLATGCRETSRAARFIGGTKPGGVMNTGTLQGLVYLKGRRPFRNPVVVGTELVAFSALLTCRHAGIRPLAMIEPAARPTARWPCALFPRLQRIPLWLGTCVDAICGERWVEAVRLKGPGGDLRTVKTDGVILSGGFRPDAVLVRASHLAFDPATRGPEVDQYGRCSDPDFFAAGNILRPVETAGWSYREGWAAGEAIAKSLSGMLPAAAPALKLQAGSADVRFAVPQRVVPAPREDRVLQFRAGQVLRGRLALTVAGEEVASVPVNTRPERRIVVPLSMVPEGMTGDGVWTFHKGAA